MGKQIYFTDEETTELMWIVPQFKNLHEEDWSKKEAEVVDKIIKKIVDSPLACRTS